MQYFGVCDGSIFGDAAELIVSRKGTVNWCTTATSGYRTLYTIHYTIHLYDQRGTPRLVSTLTYNFYFSLPRPMALRIS